MALITDSIINTILKMVFAEIYSVKDFGISITTKEPNLLMI